MNSELINLMLKVKYLIRGMAVDKVQSYTQVEIDTGHEKANVNAKNR